MTDIGLFVLDDGDQAIPYIVLCFQELNECMGISILQIRLYIFHGYIKLPEVQYDFQDEELLGGVAAITVGKYKGRQEQSDIGIIDQSLFGNTMEGSKLADGKIVFVIDVRHTGRP